mmetsp:Transcript_29573/g.84327  ORF Transcript_29573/g.84327 Transcript_29573/m.84327 type:complete len:239 (+) Transcript_29573:211-927(+)
MPVVEAHAAHDDPPGVRRDVLGDVRRPPVHEHLAREVGQGRDGLVGQRPAADLDEDAAHGPDVDLLRDLGLAVEQLRGHVPGGTAVVLLGDVGALHRLREAEVADLDVEAQVEDDVQRLEVAVHHDGGLRVQVHHSVGDLQAHVQRVVHGQLQLAHVEQVVQGAAGHVLCDEARVGQLEAGADEAHEALVPQVAEGLDLLGQVLHHELRHRVIPIELLDGDLLLLVGAAEDLAELSGA